MSPIGVKVCTIQCEGGWKGYYRIPQDKGVIEKFTDTIRKSSYDAFNDAIFALRKWSEINNTPLITDYYQI